MDNPRQLAFIALRSVQRGAYADVALDRILRQTDLSSVDRRLVTELVYGSVRRQRSLDALIDQLAKKKAQQQPPDLRIILHLGLYQLRYLDHIPDAAAVNSTVELAKKNGFSGLASFVNGFLRQYLRLASGGDPLELPDNPVERLGTLHSYPDWIIEVWLEQFGYQETEQLCEWLNKPPAIDLRINPLRASLEKVVAALQEIGVNISRIANLPQALRFTSSTGAIEKLPGFDAGWWTVQDSSAQLVSHILDPQPGEVVIDACAAPGGKTTHIAELMQDTGTIWACDRTVSRLKKLQQNIARLQLKSIQICTGDSRNLTQFTSVADRVLLDAPCSGLGTLHRHADARWRQTPTTVAELVVLQTELLTHVATWVKPGGILIYATCTLHPQENEAIVQDFLTHHPHWRIERPAANSIGVPYATTAGWMKVLPHHQAMDGFFIVRLQKEPE
ncbi:16S rRNA (cytosine(967)-C(5))-methyltransferase [Gloeocapsopsis dulcis]|uniref:16S rRNA (cytosine(967)-C(5))-methyltransferase n=1 Tax=Gloeocapsopsis dulcis AAB1 = 1H9 TaxID=1433147 RepID=A0A6N8FU18_9CHRO|nr:16S rRNA (cytosine(967)-C(5))-methyltransferase [Gloeocapsopsis dulcis]MUL35657.1 16S rRNA (cytosine(967)-C(5))-methyltransferase [Gloeocapsopsis dulcis AAB1 = 1H9]WNN87443.1 16S rRNA (cytosine(967)-C(5))-methyltransferase [Gloeocapsopsis dulcis]